MLIEQKIEKVKLSPAQKDVMQYFLTQRLNIKEQTIKEIAQKTYTSTGTVMRVAKKLGYQGFEDFKDDFLKEVIYLNTHFQNIDPNFPFNQNDNIQKIASKITLLAQETMTDTLSLIEHDSLQTAVQLLRKAKNIHLAAASYCLLLGQLFQLDMIRIGVNVHISSLSGEELFIPAIMDKDDCMILISYSGEMKTLCQLAKMLKEKHVKIIAITSLGDNELKKYADVTLHISTREKLYSKIAGYSNENSIKLILDILYSCYFALDYETNIQKRIGISKEAEIGRTSQLDIMKEQDI